MGEIELQRNFKKICLWLLPWFPVLQMYYIGKIPLGFIVYVPMLLALLFGNRKLKVDPLLLLLFLALLFVELLQMFLPYIDATVTWHNMIMQTVYLLLLIGARNYVSLEELIKPYTVVCMIFIAGLFYQVLQLYVLGERITGPITLFPSLLSDKNIYLGSALKRPMSFFSEPQAFATYIAVFNIIALERKRFILAALATVSVLLSTSTEGLALVGVTWALYIVFSKTSLLTKIVLITAIVVLAGWYTSAGWFEVGYDKALSTKYEENLRLVNGFNMLGSLKGEQLWLGVGTGVNDFYTSYTALRGLDLREGMFGSSAAGEMVNYGLIVGLLYWLFLLRSLVFRYRYAVIFSIVLIIIPFAQSCFFNASFVTLFVMYYLFIDYCRKKEVRSLKTGAASPLISPSR